MITGCKPCVPRKPHELVFKQPANSDLDLKFAMQDSIEKKDDNPHCNLGIPLNTAEMFGDSSELEIKHRGETYRLRITRQGKLILTK